MMHSIMKDYLTIFSLAAGRLDVMDVFFFFFTIFGKVLSKLSKRERQELIDRGELGSHEPTTHLAQMLLPDAPKLLDTASGQHLPLVLPPDHPHDSF